VGQQALAGILDQIEHALEVRGVAVVGVGNGPAVVRAAELGEAAQLGPMRGRAARRDSGEVAVVHHEQQVDALEVVGGELKIIAAIPTFHHVRARGRRFVPAWQSVLAQRQPEPPPWRDGTTHLVMSPLEFMQLPIKGRFGAARSTCSTTAEGVGIDPSMGGAGRRLYVS